jgi:histidine triad (HIT) family protein
MLGHREPERESVPRSCPREERRFRTVTGSDRRTGVFDTVVLMVYRHAPSNYFCPLCELAAGRDNPAPHCGRADRVFYTDHVTAFIGARFWPNNPAPVIVVPNQHVENLYELGPELGAHIHEAARQAALALKRVRRCAGITTWQHNEPAGNQSVWHYHLHVFPRYDGDGLYELSQQHRYTTPEERAPYAEQLREYFAAADASGART